VSNSGDCLNRAASRSSTAIFDLLLARGAKLENSKPLHAAVESMNEDSERIPMMAHLLELGVDVNGLDAVRRLGTPLHHAVHACKIERARFLLERGADPHIKNQYGNSALEIARINERIAFVELFTQDRELATQ
jgi:ankyrin repeat protein